MRRHSFNVFPDMTAEEFEGLLVSIREHGQKEPILLYEGAILDGWNRWRACSRLRAEPKTREFKGSAEAARTHVITSNERRNLTASQRDMVAARLSISSTHGGDRSKVQICTLTVEQAAKAVNTSVRGAKQARAVLERGSRQLAAAVDRGDLAVSRAASIADAPEREQLAVVANRKDTAALRAARAAATEERRKKKEQRKPEPPAPLALTAEPRKEKLGFYSVKDWEALLPTARERVIAAGFESDAGMNAQESDSIEWARHSLNTVTGCLHGCPYCYARDIANQKYAWAPSAAQRFDPFFHPARLSGPGNVKVSSLAEEDASYRNVFANSMSDLFGQWVPAEWIEATLEMARRNPQWNFLTLTKFPQRAAEFEFPDNVWMGTTVDAQARVAAAEKAFAKIACKTKWLSLEPLLEPLSFERLDLFCWVVIGGSSRSVKTPEWIPPLDWVARLMVDAREAGCRIYHKTNLGLGEAVRVREFPWVAPRQKSLPAAFAYLKGMAGRVA